MIDVEMWFVWCKGVAFGMVLSVIIKEFGEWVRSRRTKRPPDGARVAPHCVHGYNGTCPECGAMQTPPRR